MMDILTLLNNQSVSVFTSYSSESRIDFSKLGNITLPIDFLSVIQDADEAEGALSWFDLQFRLLHTYRSHIRARYNRRLPVYKMPSEVLSQIFRLCIALGPWSGSGRLVEMYHFSRVCRAWRQAALDDPGIWARNIILEYPRVATKLLMRAKNHPLEVKMVLYDRILPLQTEVLQQIIAKSKTIRTLQIRTFDGTFGPLIAGLSHTSILEKLSLSYHPNKRSNTEPDNDPLGNIPLITAPQLRSLELENWKFPLSVHLLPNLTTLNINGYPRSTDGSTLSLSHLLNILQLSPNLTSLDLRNLFNPIPQSGSSRFVSPSDPLSLSRLESLCISAPIDSVVALLHSLEMPALKCVKVTPGSYRNFSSPTQNRNLCNELSQVISKAPLIYLSGPYRLDVEEHQNYLVLTLEEELWDPFLIARKSIFKVHLSFDSNSAQMPGLLTDLLMLMPYDCVRRVYVNGEFKQWETAFASLPVLSELHIRNRMDPFLDLLQRQPGYVYILKGISSLVFTHIYQYGDSRDNYSDDDDDDDNSDNEDYNNEDNDNFALRSLTWLLLDQIKLGMPLKTIDFRHCQPRNGIQNMRGMLKLEGVIVNFSR